MSVRSIDLPLIYNKKYRSILHQTPTTSMKYITLFVILGTCLTVLGIFLGFPGLLLFWLGLDFLIVAVAYAARNSGIFGKGESGQLSWGPSLLLLPYLLFTWLIWHGQRLLLREDAYNYIAPGLWMGRRLLGGELPADIQLIVDLTAEFPEPQSVIRGKDYICLPTLDANVPNLEAFRDLVKTIANCDGNVYIHCAIGHGRSATVAAAVLLEKGLAQDVQSAENWLKKARPWIKLNSAQRSLLERAITAGDRSQ
jgi:protein-tyrosine phosphatase